MLSADNDGTSEHMMCEKRFVEGSEYLRFTNNTDYVMLEVTANLKRVDMNVVRELCAFSHWTFQVSISFFSTKTMRLPSLFYKILSTILNIYSLLNFLVAVNTNFGIIRNCF